MTMPSEAYLRQQENAPSLARSPEEPDAACEHALHRVARLARTLFNAPMASIGFAAGREPWFTSREGLLAWESPDDRSLCLAALEEDGPLVVPDTRGDSRFKLHPFVAGEPHIRFYAGVPLRARDSHPIGTLCVMDTRPRGADLKQVEVLRDLGQLVVDELELRRLARTDALTGALSRRAFRNAGARLVAAAAARDGQELACALFDVDRIGAINDEIGYAVGDLVLAQVCATCRARLGDEDLLGRIGGEEFAILLPGTGPGSAKEVVEEIREAIARDRIAGPAGPVGVTASFGFATLDSSGGNLDNLLQRADVALALAKAEGHNRCVEWRPGAAQPSALRHRVFKAGRILFHHGHSTIDCTVRSLSATGAGLDLCNSGGVPGEFKLVIESDNLHRACRIVSKRERHIEVEFQ